MCDQSSFLLFDNPEKHLHDLKDLVKRVQKEGSEEIYAPVSELCLGKPVERMILRIPDRNHPSSSLALPVWAAVKDYFRAMRPIVVEAVNSHNRREIARVSARELDGNTGAWCEQLVL